MTVFGNEVRLSEVYGVGNLKLNTAMEEATDNYQTYGTVIIDENITLNSNDTIPPHVNLRFVSGNRIIIDDNVTLRINGSIEAGLYKIFEVDLSEQSQNVWLDNARIDHVYAEWWGAKSDATEDASQYLNKIINDGILNIQLLPGAYVFTEPVDLATGLRVSGASGHKKTTIYIQDTDNPIAFHTNNFVEHVYMSDLAFSTADLRSRGLGYPGSGVAIAICSFDFTQVDMINGQGADPSLPRIYVANSLFERLSFSRGLRSGFDFNPCVVTIRDCDFGFFNECVAGIEYCIKAVGNQEYWANALHIDNCNFNEIKNNTPGSGYAGYARAIYINRGNHLKIENSRFEDIDSRILDMLYTSHITFRGNYVENVVNATAETSFIYAHECGMFLIADNFLQNNGANRSGSDTVVFGNNYDPIQWDNNWSNNILLY